MRAEPIHSWPEFVTENVETGAGHRGSRNRTELLTGWETVVFRVEDDDQAPGAGAESPPKD